MNSDSIGAHELYPWIAIGVPNNIIGVHWESRRTSEHTCATVEQLPSAAVESRRIPTCCSCVRCG